MGQVIVGNILLLFFSIYVGIFFKKFHSTYPNMDIGFHIWEVCYSKECWLYGNKLAGNIAISLGLILFGLIFPLLMVFLDMKREYFVGLLAIFVIIHLIFLLVFVKIFMHKKFTYKTK